MAGGCVVREVAMACGCVVREVAMAGGCVVREVAMAGGCVVREVATAGGCVAGTRGVWRRCGWTNTNASSTPPAPRLECRSWASECHVASFTSQQAQLHFSVLSLSLSLSALYLYFYSSVA